MDIKTNCSLSHTTVRVFLEAKNGHSSGNNSMPHPNTIVLCLCNILSSVLGMVGLLVNAFPHPTLSYKK
jgi:hypothetical protein